MKNRNTRGSGQRASRGRLISAAAALPVVFAVLLLPSCVGGPEEFASGDLLVMVYSSRHEPVVDASVREGIRLLGRSDSFGRLVLPGLPAGDRELLVRADGYAPRLVSFSFSAPTQILYVSLEPLGVAIGRLLREVDVEGMARLEQLLLDSRARREEIELVAAVRRRLEGEAGWQDSLRSLEPALGASLTGELLRAVEGGSKQ
ncbi:MAG: carboxypeptidase-like regulatory domain-containing protein [Alkalispirochaetaceae bacterium]